MKDLEGYELGEDHWQEQFDRVSAFLIFVVGVTPFLSITARDALLAKNQLIMWLNSVGPGDSCFV